MILIFTDGGGCHYKMVEISEDRFKRDLYMEALYNSMEMVFKKLKWHKQKNIITVTEVYDEQTTEKVTDEVRRVVSLERDEGEIQTFHIADKPGDISV